MASLKRIKAKAITPGSYREALIALGFLRDRIDVLKVANGDTVLFKLGQHTQITTKMCEVFLEVAKERGVHDLNAFLCGPGDSLESIPIERFRELAAMRGFVPEEILAAEGQSSGLETERNETEACEGIGDSQGARKPEEPGEESGATTFGVGLRSENYEEGNHAKSINSTTPSNGDCGAPPERALRPQQGDAENVAEPTPRLCEHTREGPPSLRGGEGEGKAQRLRAQTAQDLALLFERERTARLIDMTEEEVDALFAGLA